MPPRDDLVSVGIPTRDRPYGLLQTLTDIASQSHRNLEIIISDNASDDPENVRVAREFADTDGRVVVFAQPQNLGPVANFDFVLRKASGTYFMWAADDDRWENRFVERCVEALKQHPSAVAAVTEAQYFTDEGLCEFFPEGRAFYGRVGLETFDRVQLMLDHNYGNLFYSVFRREALLIEGRPLISALKFESLNEIPILLQVAARGDWLVLPEPGLKKQTRSATYRQARWEREGGRLPSECRAGSYNSLRSLYRYHSGALREITHSIDSMGLPAREIAKLKRRAARNIWRHLVELIVGYKVT
jgi:glycosyltransferase involved in cell wall biosynthesis